MLDQIETLLALKKYKTMTKASTVLRISQSAVSKRITALENYYGVALIERVGRNVFLTKKAEELIKKISPLISEIKDALTPEEEQNSKISIGVAESVLSSWGPRVLLPILNKLKVNYEFHSHRSPIVQDKIASGEYDIGICAGKINQDRSLIVEHMFDEEMVLVSLKGAPKKIISIEETSATWKSIKPNINFNIDKRLESFFSIAQLAKSGAGTGLIPKGVSIDLNFQKEQVRSLKPKTKRPIQVLYRKSKLDSKVIRDFLESLLKVKI